jgi:hypothetical protein
MVDPAPTPTDLPTLIIQRPTVALPAGRRLLQLDLVVRVAPLEGDEPGAVTQRHDVTWMVAGPLNRRAADREIKRDRVRIALVLVLRLDVTVRPVARVLDLPVELPTAGT